jgi:hypothetical protein
VKLTKDKPVPWNEKDQLRIGNYSVEQLATANDNECIIVNALKGDKIGQSDLLKKIYALLLIVSLGQLYFNDTVKHKMLLAFLTVVVLLVTYFLSKIFSRVFVPKNFHSTDIFLNEDGFTAHFDAGGNMTFKVSDLEAWKISMGGASVRLKNEEVYNFYQIQEPQKLVDYLTKYAPEKLEKKDIWSSKYLIPASVVVGFLISQFVPPAILKNSMFLILILITMVAAIAVKKSRWKLTNKFFTFKKLRLQMVGLCLLAYVFMGDDHQTALDHQNYCSSDNKDYCKLIDYDVLKIAEIDPKKALLACESSNKSACRYLKGNPVRGVASEK